jgi:hypothetical protein
MRFGRPGMFICLLWLNDRVYLLSWLVFDNDMKPEPFGKLKNHLSKAVVEWVLTSSALVVELDKALTNMPSFHEH